MLADDQAVGESAGACLEKAQRCGDGFAIFEGVTRSPCFAGLGAERARQLGSYLDAHYGAILGKLFFGMYLGLVGTVGALTGLPFDIRHVAFSSANVGTALVSRGWNGVRSRHHAQVDDYHLRMTAVAVHACFGSLGEGQVPG